ncbi:MAG: chromate transporter [Fibrobacterota bacterium]
MNLFTLYLIFFKLGLFTIGGGLASLPLLQNEAYSRGWLTETGFADIIAVSQSSPGPIGINMATFVGFQQAHFFGAVVATLGIVSPSIIIIILIARFFLSFNEKPFVRSIMYGIRPVVIGLIAAAAFIIARVTLINTDVKFTADSFAAYFAWKEILLFMVVLPLVLKFDIHPILFITGGAIVGMIVF